jgi:hypothetical protein
LLKAWPYFYRFFESDFAELAESFDAKKGKMSFSQILSSLMLRPLRFPKQKKNESTYGKLTVVIETPSQLKQFQFIRDELKNTFGNYTISKLNQAVKINLDKEENLEDSTQKFVFKVYLKSIVQFLILFFQLKGFLKRYSQTINRNDLLFFLSKAIYDHLFWVEHFQKSFVNDSTQKCVLAFKGEKYPMRTVMRIASLHGYSFYSVQHGFIGASSKYKFANPNCYFVWSHYFGEQLRKSGVRSEIVVSGNLQYRNITEVIPKKEITRKVIFLPNSGNSTTPEREVRWATQTYLNMLQLGKVPFDIYIKPHPGDSRVIVKSEANLFSNKFPECKFNWIDPKERINFEEFDVVVTMNSTSSVEANLFATPAVILLSHAREMLFPDIIAYDLKLMVHNEKDLCAKIIEIQTNIQLRSEEAMENSKKFFGPSIQGPNLICKRIIQILNA